MTHPNHVSDLTKPMKTACDNNYQYQIVTGKHKKTM